MATGSKSSADLIDIDGSDSEIEESNHEFDLKFDDLFNMVFSDAYESANNPAYKNLELETLNFPADDETLIHCLSQIEEKENQNVAEKNLRFPEMKEKDFLDLEENKDSRGTMKQTKWAVSLFREWMSENGHSVEFENLTVENLDEMLRRFYASLRNTKGDLYSKSTFVGIRASINRHLRAPPHCRKLSLLDGNDFVKSNNMFKSMLKKIKREGFDKTKHHDAISEADLQKLRSTNVLSCDDAISLQRKVWFDITLSFARRGRENLRDLKCSAFLFKTDDAGKEYVQMAYNEATKNHPGDRLKDNDHETQPRMYATGNCQCPVYSLGLYLEKRNKTNEILFQQAKRAHNYADDEWYTSRPLGEKTLNNMMKSISMDAELSNIYTNHCVRATTITLLSHAGVEAREIMRISGHRNEQSIKSYNTDSSEAQKRMYSGILHGDSPNTVELPALPVPHRSSMAMATTSTSACVAQNNTLNIQQNIPFHYQKQFDVYNSTVQVYNFFGNQ